MPFISCDKMLVVVRLLLWLTVYQASPVLCIASRLQYGFSLPTFISTFQAGKGQRKDLTVYLAKDTVLSSFGCWNNMPLRSNSGSKQYMFIIQQFWRLAIQTHSSWTNVEGLQGCAPWWRCIEAEGISLPSPTSRDCLHSYPWKLL